MPQRRRLVLILTALAMALGTQVVPVIAQPGPAVCPALTEVPTFTQNYIDTTRAGGEPIITTLDDGSLLWGSHAGSTHFFTPGLGENPAGLAPFVQEYEGQTYYYWSDDNGEAWNFSPRDPISTGGAGVQNSGFSDPEFAVDTAGNVYVSEINLANIAVSKSSDSGRTYTLQNFFALTASDRQWMEADEEDVLYMSANTFGGGSAGDGLPVTGSLSNRMYKSVDGGVSWSPGQELFEGRQMSSDFKIDHTDGTVYLLDTRLGADDGTGELHLVKLPNARAETPPELTIERTTIAVDYNSLSSIGPSLDIDAQGNIYVTWDQVEREGGRQGGIWFTASNDGGQTWTEAVRLNEGDEMAHWPWVVAGDVGEAAVVWLQNDNVIPGQDAESSEAAGWTVWAAQTVNAFGCGDDTVPGFNQTPASDGPVHTGTMCASGTTCQAQAVDRRMGDYFAHETDADGNIVIAVSDTNSGGPVSLPLVIRQTGGPQLNGTIDLDEPEVEESEGPLEPGCALGDDGADASTDRVSRIDEADAVTLAVSASQSCTAAASTVVLARADDFPDALAATGLASEVGGPVLLTASEGLSPAVGVEIRRLGATEAILAGGTAALSAQVEEDLRDLGLTVQRIGGGERFTTARLLAAEIVARGGPVDSAILALGTRQDGDAWPDALTAGVLSGADRSPVLLVAPDQLTQPTSEALDELLDLGDSVVVSGGVAAIGQSVAQEAESQGYGVARVSGPDRYATSASLAQRAIGQGAGTAVVILASGEVFAGALVAGAAALAADGVMVLVHPADLVNSQATADFLAEYNDQIAQVLIAGDSSVISDNVLAQVRAALG